jgi:hypothetical protein
MSGQSNHIVKNSNVSEASTTVKGNMQPSKGGKFITCPIADDEMAKSERTDS